MMPMPCIPPGARCDVFGGVLVATLSLLETTTWQQMARRGGDVNGDGKIDILDAYTLALQQQTTPNHRANGLDVDAIARQAVSLRGTNT